MGRGPDQVQWRVPQVKDKEKDPLVSLVRALPLLYQTSPQGSPGHPLGVCQGQSQGQALDPPSDMCQERHQDQCPIRPSGQGQDHRC